MVAPTVRAPIFLHLRLEEVWPAVHEISADLRKPPRGPERLVITVTVWFSDDPKNPYPSERSHAALTRVQPIHGLNV